MYSHTSISCYSIHVYLVHLNFLPQMSITKSQRLPCPESPHTFHGSIFRYAEISIKLCEQKGQRMPSESTLV